MRTKEGELLEHHTPLTGLFSVRFGYSLDQQLDALYDTDKGFWYNFPLLVYFIPTAALLVSSISSI